MPRKQTRALRLWLTATHEVDQAWVKHNDSGFEVKRQIIAPSIFAPHSFYMVIIEIQLVKNLWKWNKQTLKTFPELFWRLGGYHMMFVSRLSWNSGQESTVANIFPQVLDRRTSLLHFVLIWCAIRMVWEGVNDSELNPLSSGDYCCNSKKKERKKKSLFVFVALRSRVLLILASVVRQRQM